MNYHLSSRTPSRTPKPPDPSERPGAVPIATHLGGTSAPRQLHATRLTVALRGYSATSSGMRKIVTFLALAVLLIPATSAAQSPTRDLDGRNLLPDEKNTITVFRKLSPSVVYVVNRAVQRNGYSGRTSEVQRGSGSGFIWDKYGTVVTNYHVVKGSSSISVFLDQKEYKAKVLGVEPKRDIAVLKIDPKPADKKSGKRWFTPVKPGRYRDLIVGQKVLAIGSPFGFDRTLTTGVVSALGREIVGIGQVTIPDMIQTDASINPGNSGGPLLDSAGRLIGMNTMIFSQSGSSAGIGFAVPINLITRIVPQIVKTGRAINAGLGVSIFADDASRRIGVEGVILRSVTPKSNAAKAGLRGTKQSRRGDVVLGDIVIGINGDLVKNYDDLYNALDNYAPGDQVTVHFIRNKRKKKTKVRLVEL